MFPMITSRDNQKLKLARKVRDGKLSELIFLEGIRLAEEAIRSNVAIRECLISSDFQKGSREKRLLGAIKDAHLETSTVLAQLFDSLTDTIESQGIILIANRADTSVHRFDAKVSAARERLRVVIFLYEINNPSNLGAILRTAEAAGAAGVVVSKRSADPFSPKALRSAMGASLRVPIWDRAEAEDVFEWATHNKFSAVAADIKSAIPFTDRDWTRPTLLAFGSEAHGLPNAMLREMETVYIPMENEVESLNLAVSAGIILFEAKRQNS